MTAKNTGKITQIIGAVVDISFENELPSLYNAVEVPFGEETIVLRSCSILVTTQCAVFPCTPQMA